MKCAVLLGFSTTGKSSILRDFRAHHGNAIDTLDSDEQVSQPNGGHIYNVYLHFRDGPNTATSIQAIEGREREFLRTAGVTVKPLLLASGPFLPIRQPEWSAFVARVRPVFIYLQKSPEDVLNGLLERRTRQLEDPVLASNPGFGCWDQGVTTEYHDGRWIEIDHDQALQNVRRNMAGMVAIYRQLASQTFTWQERQSPEGRERLNAAIRRELGV
jgi:shikimate kinase